MNILRYFKRYRFDPKKFRLGMRTFKTGLSVFLVLLCFHWFGWDGMQIAALTAIFSLREDFNQSVHFGMSRVIANSIGGFYALFYFVLERAFPGNSWVLLLGVPIGVMLTIMTCVATNTGGAIIGGSAAFLIISLSIPSGESVLYVFTRVLETFFGVFVAILVNYDINQIRSMLLKRTS